MNRTRSTNVRLTAFLAVLCLWQNSSWAQEANNLAMSAIDELGDERYQIGEIIVDRNSSEFTVPGKILHLSDALEYLAVSEGGMKDYESLLALTTSPRDFNLACILIGLDDSKSTKPRYQFDEREAGGQSVAITLRWQVDGESRSVSGGNAMTAGDKKFGDDRWVYLGSSTSENGLQFMADRGGTLISFVHDPYSIIDHRTGGGIGAYGLLTGDESVLPPEGTPISLTVALDQE
jgi:hypothetical protein